MPKRIAHTLVNLVWHGTVLTIVLTALVITIGRELLPQINLQGDRLARYINANTQADIRFNNLRAQWVQPQPEFSASAIDIHMAHVDIHMNKVLIQLDVINSLLERAPVFSRLEIDSATVHYQSPATQGNNNLDTEKAWHTIYSLLRGNISIHNIDVTIDEKDKVQHVNLVDFRVEQTLLNKKVFMRLSGQDGQDNVYVVGTLTGDSLSQSTGNFYIKASGLSTQEWLPASTTVLPSALQTWRDTPWQINGEIWLDWQGLDVVSGIADLQINKLSTNTTNNNEVQKNDNDDKHDAVLPDHIQALISGNRNTRQQQLLIHNLSLQHGEKNIALINNLQIDYQTDQWHVRSPALALAPLSDMAPFLPNKALHELLTSLHPTGYLRNLDLTWNNNKPLLERMRLRTIADNLNTGDWHGVPAFTQVNGYVDSGIGYGFIDLDSQHGFSMFYPSLYHEPLTFDQAAGRVQWEWQPDEKTVLVGSDYASLSSSNGEAHGNFWLRLALPEADFISEMNLMIGLRNSHAAYRNKLLPHTLPESLLDWLKTSIGEATITDAGFLFRGPLADHAAFSHAIQFYANIQNGDVQFDPHWPRLTDITGKVLVDDGITTVRTFTSKIYNSTVTDAWVQAIPQAKGLLVNVEAQANGNTEDGIRILQETSLHDTMGTAFDDWKVTQGNLNTRLQLAIPLLGSDSVAMQDVRCQLTDSRVILNDLRLPIEKLNGDLIYQSHAGIFAPTLEAQLFEQAVKLDISSTKNADDLNIDVNFTGTVATPTLAEWSRMTPMQVLRGDIDYAAKLTLGPFGKHSNNKVGSLTINSTMKQVALPLPEPLVKKPGSISPLTLTIDLLRNNRQDYRVEYNRQIHGAISMRKGTFFSGLINIADGTTRTPSVISPPTTSGPLQISGTLPQAKLEDWISVVSAYNRLPKKAEAAPTPFPEFSIHLGNITGQGMQFPDTAITIQHRADGIDGFNAGWQVGFKGERATGMARFYDEKPSTPIQLPDIAFNTLKIDTTGTNSIIMSKNPIQFSDVPSLNLFIEHLIYNGMDIGNISMNLDSQPDALQLHKVLAQGPGYQVKAQKTESQKPNDNSNQNKANTNEGAEITWRRNADGLYQSEFHGLLHMQGEQPALMHLGIDPFVQGKNIYLSADIVWPGSPFDLKITSLYGQINAYGEDGQYLQAESSKALKAISVLDIATWARRLRLDFSDLTNDGISFDKFKGALSFNNGTMEFTEPLHVQSPSSSIRMAGKAFLNSEQLDLIFTATLPVGNNAAWIAAIAGGLPAAAGVYVVSKVFDKQLKQLTSVSYTITGAMADPDIAFKRLAPPKLETTTTPP
jgi:uncharacterized protein (TIGR02099 family)